MTHQGGPTIRHQGYAVEARALWHTEGEVMHGYSTADLTRLARYATKRSLQLGQIPADASLGDMAEIATEGIIDALVEADAKPTDIALMRAGQNEIRRQVRRRWYYDRGLTATGTPGRGYYKFWGEYFVSSGRTNRIAKGSHAA